MRLAAILFVSALTAAPAAAQPSYRPAPSSAQGYDRSTYPPSTYDRGGASTAQPGAEDRGAPPQDADIGRELNLRADQRAAYDAYRDAFRPDEARDRQAQEMEGRLAGMTTPQRLDYARQEMERDRADFERTDAATRRFYGGLSAEQRRTFDRVTAPAPDTDDDDGAPSGRQPQPR